MREILFRGKREDNGKWIYGFPFSARAILFIEGIETWDGERHLVNNKTVGQFIGLTDKNCRKIFEGDICRFRESKQGCMCWTGVVKYDYQQFIISGGPNTKCETPFYLVMSRFIPEDIEVIGNVHDNPELLEDKQYAV